MSVADESLGTVTRVSTNSVTTTRGIRTYPRIQHALVYIYKQQRHVNSFVFFVQFAGPAISSSYVHSIQAFVDIVSSLFCFVSAGFLCFVVVVVVVVVVFAKSGFFY